jgi:pyruvate kinase
MIKITKKTKIIATIGPASQSKEMLEKFILEGVNVIRINFSHGDHQEHLEKINIVKDIYKKKGLMVAIMGDTKGPEIRTGEFSTKIVDIKAHDLIKIVFTPIIGDNKTFSVTYDFIDAVKVGSHIKIDDGILDLVIKEINKKGHYVIVEASNSHSIKSRRGVNVPFAKLGMQFISEQDKKDITFMAANDVDFIACSFTRKKEDVLEIKQLLKQLNKENIKIIAKIENREGFDNIEEIVKVSDGIMVARGDLGVEVEPEEVPFMQKKIIEACFRQGKPVITATQMLDSMQRNPMPTRAEVSDVANAIIDNCDCVMLSGESASGDFPLESVIMQSRIAAKTEQLLNYPLLAQTSYNNSLKTINNALAFSISEIAFTVNARLVVAMTSSGSTPRRIAKFRPCCPIIAVCDKLSVALGLQLVWGVYPHLVEFAGLNLDQASELAFELAAQLNLPSGSNIVLAGGTYKGNTDYLKVLTTK